MLSDEPSQFGIPQSSYRMFEMKQMQEDRHVNEIKQKNGKFGWCFICRNKANFYSIKFRVSICSHECISVLQSRHNQMDNDSLTRQKLTLIKDKKRELNKGINIVIHLCNLGASFPCVIISLRSRQVEFRLPWSYLLPDFRLFDQFRTLFPGRQADLHKDREVFLTSFGKELGLQQPE
jgi:hypothetical protein